ncbi:MAG: phosphoglucosamine mutase [Desulfomonile tiedjei]|uniref:Phosphoglucosamine mutase n=1 Tax=Desulfomonile tiedjei TaxID=2358 RepID=A0A9D6Z4B6_9BACT|nr:phosphoglucosamine mutase [Desulfomonile tiedjei]
MANKLFGTDGVRGIANLEPMTAETALKLGRAIAHLTLIQPGRRHKILLGKDTRLSCYMLETALAAGICSMGADVLMVGPIPTPGIAFLTTNMRCDAGAVISASHNPFQDNGIKFFSRDGFKLSDELESEIERLIFSNNIDEIRPTAEKIGKAFRIDDALGRYVVFVKNTFPRSLTLDGINVVLDCANGAAYKAAPLVFEELGANVTALGINPDGQNINHNCGSLFPELMCTEVRIRGAHVGIALDGDADRVIFADEKGNVVNGDQVMGLIAQDMMSRNELRKNTLVATVMSNMGLEVAIKDLGGQLVRTPVGDRHVVERMRRDGYNFGGEQSGHLIFLDQITSGDGILSALQVLRIMKETGKTLSEVVSLVKLFPQVLTNVEVRTRKELAEVPQIKEVMDECHNRLKDRGRLLVRYSGTQLLCRVMAEGEDEVEVKQVVEMVANAISTYL